MSDQLTVADYIISRLAREGITEKHLSAGGVRLGGNHSRQLRARNGAADRHRAGGNSARARTLEMRIPDRVRAPLCRMPEQRRRAALRVAPPPVRAHVHITRSDAMMLARRGQASPNRLPCVRHTAVDHTEARKGRYSRRALTPSKRRLYGLSERTVEFAANRRE